MAEVLILLRRDPKTGKQNIIVKLESDPDSLPIEHEQLHKRIVEKLVGKGMKAEDLGDIVIERERGAQKHGAAWVDICPAHAEVRFTRPDHAPARVVPRARGVIGTVKVSEWRVLIDRKRHRGQAPVHTNGASLHRSVMER